MLSLTRVADLGRTTGLSSTSNLNSKFLGLQKYQDVLALQAERVRAIRGTKAIQIFGMEFQPVITLGVRGDLKNDLAWPRADIPIVQTDRGGQATMHTPGQLVVYPMIDLKTYGIGVRDFVCIITRATSAILKKHGIESFSTEAPGLFTVRGKIAFIGIRLDRGVVRHGLSLNVNNDLASFESIRSCGVSAAMHDRVRDYRASSSEGVDLAMVFHAWVVEFERELDLVQRANNVICDLQSVQEPLSLNQ